MKVLNINETELRVHKNGVIERKLKSGKWKVIENTANHNQGYNVILIQKKQYMRSHLVYLAYSKKIDKVSLYHKDGNRLNCAVDNLLVEHRN